MGSHIQTFVEGLSDEQLYTAFDLIRERLKSISTDGFVPALVKALNVVLDGVELSQLSRVEFCTWYYEDGYFFTSYDVKASYVDADGREHFELISLANNSAFDDALSALSAAAKLAHGRLDADSTAVVRFPFGELNY